MSLGTPRKSFIYGFGLTLLSLSLTISSHAQTLHATIPTGSYSYPGTPVVDSANNRLYVTVNGNNAVKVINLTTSAVIATIPVGTNPSSMTMNSATGLVYVTNQNSSSITVINPSNNYSTTTVRVPAYPKDIAVNPVNNKIYIAHYSATPIISVVDPSNGNAVSTITPSVSYQWKVAINPSTGVVYTSGANGIGCNCTSAISAINPSTQSVTTIPVGQLPYSMAIDAKTGNVYVSNQASSYIDVISPANGYATTTVPVSGTTGTRGVVLDAAGRVFAVPENGNNILVLDPNQGYAVTSIPINVTPDSISFDSKYSLMAIAAQTSSTQIVTYINTGTLAQGTTLTFSGSDSGVLSNGTLGQTYAINSGTMAVEVIND